MLLDANLIVRQRRTLSLTEAGQEEVQRIMTGIPIKAKKATDLATQILGQATESLAYTKKFGNTSQILMSMPNRRVNGNDDRFSKIYRESTWSPND